MENEITIYEVIESLKKEYEKAKKKSFIAKPLALCASQRLESNRYGGKAA